MICGRGGGGTHELVRDDHVFVCLWDVSSSLWTIYGLTNDTVLIMISYPVGVKFCILFSEPSHACIF